MPWDDHGEDNNLFLCCVLPDAPAILSTHQTKPGRDLLSMDAVEGWDRRPVCMLTTTSYVLPTLVLFPYLSAQTTAMDAQFPFANYRQQNAYTQCPPERTLGHPQCVHSLSSPHDLLTTLVSGSGGAYSDTYHYHAPSTPAFS